MTNILQFEKQIKKKGLIPLEVKLEKNLVHFFICHRNHKDLVVYNRDGKAFILDNIDSYCNIQPGVDIAICNSQPNYIGLIFENFIILKLEREKELDINPLHYEKGFV